MKKLVDFLRTCPNDYRIAWDYYIEFIGPVLLFNGNQLRHFKALVLDNEKLFLIKDLLEDEYLRATIYIVGEDYEFDMDRVLGCSPKDYEAVYRSERIKLRRNAKWSFSVNDPAFIGSRVMALEGPPAENSNAKLINSYIAAIKELGSLEDFRDEYLSANIDLPEYGVIGKKLFVVNREDPYIRQMISFYKEKSAKGLPKNVVSFYYFAEDLQRKLTHIPIRFVQYMGKELMAEVDFNMEGKIDSDSGSVLKIPLKKCYITKTETDNIVKLFGRSFAYDD